MDYEADDDTCCYLYTWKNPQRIDKGAEDIEIRGQVETIQTTALLRTVRILGKVLDIWELLSLKLQWKTIS